MDRRAQILSMFDASGFGLEIGPSYNPLLPKTEGFNVETIDYTDQDGLRLKYASNPTVDPSRIEVVDHVSDGRSMREIIGEGARYDFIVASHVIEHTPDLVGFLKDCESLLKPNGVLFLAVPDKRSCFDIYQRLTSTGEVLEAHRIGRTRPGFGSIFDAVANGVVQDDATGWPKGSKGDRKLVRSIEQANNRASVSAETGEYTDVHVWRFVPSSFRLILNDLFDLGETPLRIQRFEAFDEFRVVLSRDPAPASQSRLELLRQVNEEHAYEHLVEAAETARAEIARNVQSLSAKNASLESVRGENERLRLALSNAEAEVEALRSSTSWRITRPLRALRGG